MDLILSYLNNLIPRVTMFGSGVGSRNYLNECLSKFQQPIGMSIEIDGV